MDHNNHGDQKYSHCQCAHGMCLDHGPEWENVGDPQREPNPGLFGKKTYWTTVHCEKSMARYRVVQAKRCKKCGRIKVEIVDSELALCLCCGYHFVVKQLDQGGDIF